MDLGLFRREHLQSADPRLIGQATSDQFQRTHGALQAWAEAEHTDDGSHTDIHATSIDLGPAGSWDANGDFSATGGSQDLGEFAFRSGADASSLVGESMTVGVPVAGEAWQLSRYPAGPFGVSGYSWQLRNMARVAVTNDFVYRIGYYNVGGYHVLQPGTIDPFALGVPGLSTTWALKHVVTTDGYYERNRSKLMGEWTDQPYNAAHYASSSGTWTVNSGNALLNRYMLIGKTLFWNVLVTASVISGGQNALYVTLPAGMIAQTYNYSRVGLTLFNGVWGVDCVVNVNPLDSRITIRRTSLANFVASASSEIYFIVTMEIQ